MKTMHFFQWLPESARYDVARGDMNSALATLQRIAEENGKPMPLGKLVESHGKPVSSIDGCHVSIHRSLWEIVKFSRCCFQKVQINLSESKYLHCGSIFSLQRGPACDKSVLVNSLWPRNAIWWHGSGSTFDQVKPCCLTAPSHYLNQCLSSVRSSNSHLTAILQKILLSHQSLKLCVV